LSNEEAKTPAAIGDEHERLDRSLTPNKPGTGCRQVATSNRGYVAYVFRRAEIRPRELAPGSPFFLHFSGRQVVFRS
jgi:hypothetical protein